MFNCLYTFVVIGLMLLGSWVGVCMMPARLDLSAILFMGWFLLCDLG